MESKVGRKIVILAETEENLTQQLHLLISDIQGWHTNVNVESPTGHRVMRTLREDELYDNYRYKDLA
jgi:hypothetical protein